MIKSIVIIVIFCRLIYSVRFIMVSPLSNLYYYIPIVLPNCNPSFSFATKILIWWNRWFEDRPFHEWVLLLTHYCKMKRPLRIITIWGKSVSRVCQYEMVRMYLWNGEACILVTYSKWYSLWIAVDVNKY